MRILNLCEVDYAGVGINLTQAIDRTTSHEARHIRARPHRFGYPKDIQTTDPEEVGRWLDWADVVNVHVTFRPLRRCGARPSNLLITHHGTHYRGRFEQMNDLADEWGAKTLCTTPDMVQYGPTWVPVAIPVDRYRRLWGHTRDKPIVCQTPSNPERKATDRVRRLLEGRDDIELRIVHDVSHVEALIAKAGTHIFVDKFVRGLGVSGLEALAMGIPVIADAEPEDEAGTLREIGYLPYYKASVDKLSEAVDALLDPSIHREWVERGTEYIRAFHDYPAVAERYACLCEEVMDGVQP